MREQVESSPRFKPEEKNIMANTNFEKLVAAVDRARAAYREAQAKLAESVESVDLGTTVIIDSIPWMVQQNDGKKVLNCLMSKKAIAAMRGEQVPYKPRVRRTKAAIEAAKAAE